MCQIQPLSLLFSTSLPLDGQPAETAPGELAEALFSGAAAVEHAPAPHDARQGTQERAQNDPPDVEAPKRGSYRK